MALTTPTEGQPYDLFIVGGGINGCGIARDGAGRGLSVCLAEMGDLAGATSSGSTKLIHGGLRYLEFYKFDLVRKALMEREVLWNIAPHIIRPLRFILPHHQGLRPAWMLRLGLFLYDHLGGRKLLPATRVVNFRKDQSGTPLQTKFSTGFEYSDCSVDDARLVVLNAMDAAERGARIMTRTKVLSAQSENEYWTITTQDAKNNTQSHRARILVNATGPWVNKFLTATFGKRENRKIRMVRGSHIVVPKIDVHDRCYILQNADKRVFFAIPYEQNFTLIGTTDCDFDDDPGNARISGDEIAYLCASFNAYFTQTLKPTDVVWSYSAVRPLADDSDGNARKASRDYDIETSHQNGRAPLINVYGGKITTYRKLGEAVLEKVGNYIKIPGKQWSDSTPLPGGNFPVDGFERQASDLQREYTFLSDRFCRRLVRSYGTRARTILGKAKYIEDLGQCFGSDLFEAEVRYLIKHEWALKTEDILWRRTKEGLRIEPARVKKLENFLANQRLTLGDRFDEE